jgi:putative ABC transport system ATP-binding protein
MADIQLNDLTKHYRQGKETVRALDGVDLTIGAGEFVSVVGRSGSGKTTLLDLVGLLLRPTRGAVVLDGVDTSTLPDGQLARLRGRKLGFIFQEYNLLPTLNVLENVLLPLRYVKGTGADRRRGLDLLEVVGLTDRIKHRPDQLSGGQQQRVAIARALVNEPTLVLGDEPTGAVDSQTSDELIGLMRQLNREANVTFMIVTHDLELAGRTDRVIRLRDGQVVGDEATREAQPAAS